jgi:hypothetical protein
MVPFLNGIAACAGFIAGVVFLKSWRQTADRLFLWFALAFWFFALNWSAVSLLHPAEEAGHWFYLLRLVGFVLILAAVIDKNRAPED